MNRKGLGQFLDEIQEQVFAAGATILGVVHISIQQMVERHQRNEPLTSVQLDHRLNHHDQPLRLVLRPLELDAADDRNRIHFAIVPLTIAAGTAGGRRHLFDRAPQAGLVRKAKDIVALEIRQHPFVGVDLSVDETLQHGREC